MKKLVTLIALFFGFALNSAKAQGVAIVDLDAVAQELGVLEFIRVTLDNSLFDKRAELTKTQQSLQADMDKAFVDAGAKPGDKLDTLTPEQQKKIAPVYRDLETKFQQSRFELEKQFEIEKLKMIDDFRKDLKPHALTVAKKHQMAVVLNKVMPPVYAFEEGVDITKEVTEAAKKAGLAKKIPARKTP